MPTYDFYCVCGWRGEHYCKIDVRDMQCCPKPGCRRVLKRELAAPMGKVAGQTAKGGGADRFTADMLGIKTGDLPDYLKADYGVKGPAQRV